MSTACTHIYPYYTARFLSISAWSFPLLIWDATLIHQYLASQPQSCRFIRFRNPKSFHLYSILARFLFPYIWMCYWDLSDYHSWKGWKRPNPSTEKRVLPFPSSSRLVRHLHTFSLPQKKKNPNQQINKVLSAAFLRSQFILPSSSQSLSIPLFFSAVCFS